MNSEDMICDLCQYSTACLQAFFSVSLRSHHIVALQKPPVTQVTFSKLQSYAPAFQSLLKDSSKGQDPHEKALVAGPSLLQTELIHS